VFKYVGQFSFVLAVLSAVTLGVSLAAGEYGLALRYGVVILALLGLGMLTLRLPHSSSIQGNEALSITSLVFVLASLLMAYPMMGSGLSFGDALFESVSAVTTTGLSTLPSVEGKPATFLFSRAWLQWAGGLGIVVFSVALLLGPGTAARRLALTETDVEDMASSTRAHARRVLAVYLLLTGLGVLALWLFGASPFDSLLHTLAAVSTGGFSSFDDSLGGLGNYNAAAAAIALCFLGAVPLALYHRAFRKGVGEMLVHFEATWLLALCLLTTGMLLFFLVENGGFSLGEALRHAPLIGFSAQTTAGFSTLDVSKLDPASKLVLIVSMAVGGNVGSTAGGIKVFRILVMLRLMQLAVRRTFLPARAVAEPYLGGSRLEWEEIERALTTILFFTTVIVLSWLSFVAMGYDPLDSLFEVVSATGTVGLSTGVTSPELPAFLKGILCADMIMGRLEVVAILVLLYPRTWLGRRYET
jgi:trk system potassium uptake protein TrkH